MQSAETVLDVLRERGRRGLPCTELYRQLFNPSLYLMAYGRIYANHGAMTPGCDGETADGMSQARIGRIIDAMRHERYRFAPARRVYIPKKDGRRRPLGLPSWGDNSSARWCACCWRRTTSRGFPPVPTVSVPAGAAAERQDRSCSRDERFLRAQDAELVALGVGEHGPRLRAALPDVDPACAERENPFDLGVAAARAGGEVKVQAVLHRFAVGHWHEADSHRCGFVGADDDFSLTLRQDLPVQHLGPEPGLSR